MNVPAPGSSMLKHLQSRMKLAHGVNPSHRCVIGQCAFRSWPVRLPGIVAPVTIYVCPASLQYHLCGKNTCNCAPILHSDGTRVCPISAKETAGPKEVYYPSRTKGRGSWSRPFSHTMAPEKHKRATKRKRSAHASTAAALGSLLLSEKAEELRLASRRRQAQRVTSAVLPLAPFLVQMREVRRVYPRKRRPPADQAQRNVDALAPPLHAYIERIKPHLGPCKGHNALVAACVAFLSKGLRHAGVEIIPKLKWVAELAPCDSDYGKIPGFQSRPLSVASRMIKTTATTPTGAPNVAFVYRQRSSEMGVMK